MFFIACIGEACLEPHISRTKMATDSNDYTLLVYLLSGPGGESHNLSNWLSSLFGVNRTIWATAPCNSLSPSGGKSSVHGIRQRLRFRRILMDFHILQLIACSMCFLGFPSFFHGFQFPYMSHDFDGWPCMPIELHEFPWASIHCHGFRFIMVSIAFH